METKDLDDQEKYLNLIHESVRKTLDYEQKQEIIRAMQRLDMPVKKHHRIDLRFTFWFIKRWYVVLMAGPDVRKARRGFEYTMLQKSAIVFMQLLLYAIIASLMFLGLYLFKSALGIDIFSNFHFSDIFSR